MKKLLFFLLLISQMASAYINIHPLKFDKKIDGKGEGEQFTLYNPTSETIKYSIYFADEEIKNSMKGWVDFYPSSLTLTPGKKGEVKIFVKAPKDAKAGEYLATMGIKEISLPKTADPKENHLKILTHLKMDLAGYVGDISPKIELQNFSYSLKDEKLEFKGSMRNSGERRGYIDFYLSNGKIKDDYHLGTVRILRDEEENLEKLNQIVTDKKLIKNIRKYKKIILKDQFNGKLLGEYDIKL
ncbi:MAG: hypothetical protein ACRC40_03500 [Fusobacteriaceae bacterium]